MSNISVGSVCSGVEAASVAWNDLGFNFKWFSETAEFPSRLLEFKYKNIKNYGDMCDIPHKLINGQMNAPDLICGGTPCQAFSLAGRKNGLGDDRGNLTLKFVDIVNANDEVRNNMGLKPSLIFWENVEGILRDKTNAFGSFLSHLAGHDKEIVVSKWPQAGIIRGPKRNIAWRILDAKYFGLPQQRRRLYLLAGGKDFYPEKVLFETYEKDYEDDKYDYQLSFVKDGNSIEIFRGYTDCLYSAYGTKWNGNAAAYNGSLFVFQNNRLRRFTPLECERLMGFPDNYTEIPGSSSTSRYQGVGNSWAVPVVRWLGKRLINYHDKTFQIDTSEFSLLHHKIISDKECEIFGFSKKPLVINNNIKINFSEKPLETTFGDIIDIIDVKAAENFYITPAGCKGILRRKDERKLSINNRLEFALKKISSMWSDEKIDGISRKQNRGQLSSEDITKYKKNSLFDDNLT